MARRPATTLAATAGTATPRRRKPRNAGLPRTVAAPINATPEPRARTGTPIRELAAGIVESNFTSLEPYFGPAWKKLGEQGQAKLATQMTTNAHDRIKRALPRLMAADGAGAT